MFSADLPEPASSRTGNSMPSTRALSIIIANYNNAPYLRDCLDSILQQTFKDLEVVIADDCSSDDSPSIIREYAARYPDILKPFFSPINRGAAGTRHAAIMRANSEYITTLDSDDYYYDARKLEKEMDLVLRFKKETHRDIIAFSNIVLLGSNNKAIKTMGTPETIREGLIYHEMLTRQCMIPRDFIMKKDAYFKAGGYDVTLRTYEDWDLKIRLSRLYAFHYTHSNGTAYRRTPAGLSRLPYPARAGDMWRVFSKNIGFAQNAEKPELKRKFILFMSQQNREHLRALQNNFRAARTIRRAAHILGRLFALYFIDLRERARLRLV